MSATADDVIITSLLLSLLLAAAASQPPSATPPPPNHSLISPSVAAVMFVMLLAISFVGFFSVYLCVCSEAYPFHDGDAVLRRPASTGLSPAAIESFPVIPYSDVKEHKIGKGALECAICLDEFGDDETLRLIPKCDHVFHPECIDAWLEFHVTCPVCRANLVPDPDKKTNANSLHRDAASLEITRGAENISVVVIPAETLDLSAREESRGRRARFLGKFPRSHSTGHSLVRPGECTERFTLRLPDHIRRDVMTRALTRASTANTPEGSSRRGRRSGEGSSRGTRWYKRLDRRAKSDRWTITTPFSFQGRVTAGDGEGSTGRGIRTAVKLPSCTCLGPTTSGDGTGLVNSDPVRAAV